MYNQVPEIYTQIITGEVDAALNIVQSSLKREFEECLTTSRNSKEPAVIEAADQKFDTIQGLFQYLKRKRDLLTIMNMHDLERIHEDIMVNADFEPIVRRVTIELLLLMSDAAFNGVCAKLATVICLMNKNNSASNLTNMTDQYRVNPWLVTSTLISYIDLTGDSNG